MQMVSGSLYKDVTPADFGHYFGSTAMRWKIGVHKERLFLVGAVEGGTVKGSYLTREGEWKEKGIPMSKWWESLDPILPQPIMFNLKDGCATWFPDLTRNMRKSFPWNPRSIRFYGLKTAEEVTTQSIGRSAFLAFSHPEPRPTLVDALNGARRASVTQGDFLVDKVEGRLFYRKALIGGLDDKKIKLKYKNGSFKDLLVANGVAADDILIAQEPKSEPIPDALFGGPILDGRTGLTYLNGRHRDAWDTWFIVASNVNRGVFKTYRGRVRVNAVEIGWTLTEVSQDQARGVALPVNPFQELER